MLVHGIFTLFYSMNFICFNGAMLPAEQPLFTTANRSFKYGDGIFETIKVYNHTILLADLHFDRFFLSLRLLKIDSSESLDDTLLLNNILELCRLNNCIQSCRVRLAAYRNENNAAEYVIEAWPLSITNGLNEKGFVIDFFPDARKSMDAFANLKTANYLPYVLADRYAKEKNLDECLVLNSRNKVCDAGRGNAQTY